MTTAVKQTGKTRSAAGGLSIAAAVSMTVTLAFSAAIAYVLSTEKITWQQAGYWIMGMLFAASFLGGKCAYGSVKRQCFLMSALSGLLYWGLLLCISALFFGGNFGAVWETAGIIAAGAATAGLLRRPDRKQHTAKRRSPYR